MELVSMERERMVLVNYTCESGTRENGTRENGTSENDASEGF
jgi:hypothetical protein